MVLEQDKAQASQAQAIIAEQQYQKDLAEYEKDLTEYEKQKAEYDKQQKKIADAKLKEQTRIAEEKRKEQEKADKRAAQFAAVEKTYQETLSKDPNLGAQFPNPRSGHTDGNNKMRYAKAKESQLYQARALEAKQEAQKQLRLEHYTADGFTFAGGGTGQSDFGEAVSDYKMGRPLGYRKISARGQKQFELWLAREDLLYGKISEEQYHSRTGQSLSTYKSHEQRAAEQRSAQARAKVAGYLAADAKHWQNVASGNYDAKYPTEQKPTLHPAQKTDDLTILNDVKKSGIKLDSPETKVETKDHGYYTETILKAVDTNKSGTTLNNATEISRYISVSNETFKVPETPTAPKIPVRTNTSSRKGVNEANILQKQYVQDVRDGKVNLYQALTKPRTPQMVSKNNTINLNRYLTERGYDVTKPETIPDSVLMTVKYDTARKQASDISKPMGDLRKLIPQPQVSDTVIQQRKETMEKYAVDKGGSFIGYGNDGTPMQGAPFLKTEYQVALSDGTVRTFETEKEAEKFAQSKSITKFDVTYAEPTSIPTMYGVVAVSQPVTYTFDSEQEAQSFIDKRQASLPYTQDAKILPLEKMYSGYDQFAKEAYKRAEDHPSSWIYQGGAAWTSFGGDLLNLATMGGDLLDKYVFKRPTVPKQPITTIPTYYDKGFEEATKGIEITDTGVTGITPSLINPLDEGNFASKWYQGAAKQWEKQTPAQNIGQSTLFVPLAIIDTVTAGQAGTSVIRRVAPGVKSLATKITSTPTIVTRVVEASSVSTRTIPVKPTYANYNLNTIANPDRIDLNFKGVDYMDSPKPPELNLKSKAFEEDLASRGIKPVDQVKLDPEYSPDKIDLDFKGVDFMVSPKPPTLNLKSKAFQEDLARRPPTGAGEYGAERFRQFQENVSPSINIVGRIKFSEGFIPGKPTRQYTPFKPKEVEADPYYSPDKINLDFKGDDFMASPKPTLNLQSKSFLKDIKKQTRQPNYERAASDFADFQKSLEPKPQRYSNIVGTIKFSEGFIPGKPTRQYTPFKPKEVEADSSYKPDGKVGDILSDTVSTSPITIRTTKPDKIARIPKTGQAPITKIPRYSDIDAPKLPKTGKAPIGYIAPKPKPMSKTSTFTNIKSPTKKINLPKPDDIPKPREASQILEPPIVKPKIKKKTTPAPLDPIIDASADTPIPSTSSSGKSPIVPPVIKVKEEKEKITPRKFTSPKSITSIVTKQEVLPKVSQQPISGIVSAQKIRPTQKSRSVTRTSQPLVQSVPQKVSAAIKPKQALRSSPQPRPRLRSRPKFRFRTRVRPIQSQPDPIPGRARTVAGFAPPSEKRKEKEKKSKNRKRKEFLGNTRLDKIEGLFRRSEIVSGDKRVAKQVKLDKVFKENKPKTRRKKKKESFGQKMGIVNKGFKI